MSDTTNEINKITGTIIGISGRLIIYALIVLLLFEGVTKGYAFGHDIFYARAVDAAPGRDIQVIIPDGTDTAAASDILVRKGLIKNKTAFIVQSKFYEYEVKPGTYVLNTSKTSKELLQQLNDGPLEEEKAEDRSGGS